MDRDYYEVLGASRTASQDEIRKAYLQLARQHHPDANPDDPSAAERFQEIQNAYDVLKDSEKRSQYDHFGPNFAAAGGPGAGFEQWRTAGGPGGFSFEGVDLNDILGGMGGGMGNGMGAGMGGGSPFDGLFGGPPQGAPQGGARRRRRAPQPPPAQDVQQEITVPFQTAIRGGEIDVTVQKREKRSTLTIKIPTGIEDGKKIRLRGQGESGCRGAPSGDLILTIHPESHPHFTRKGNNLELVAPISLSEAILGAKIDIPTPNGTVALTVPAGTSGGKKFRIPGHGVPSTKGSPGNLVVQVRIVLPQETITDDEKQMPLEDAVQQIGDRTAPQRENIKF